MKLYVAKVSTSEKMVYLSCIRYIKKDNKYDVVPVSISVTKENFSQSFSGKKVSFPFIIECHLEKGKQPVLKMYGEKV